MAAHCSGASVQRCTAAVQRLPERIDDAADPRIGRGDGGREQQFGLRPDGQPLGRPFGQDVGCVRGQAHDLSGQGTGQEHHAIAQACRMIEARDLDHAGADRADAAEMAGHPQAADAGGKRVDVVQRGSPG